MSTGNSGTPTPPNQPPAQPPGGGNQYLPTRKVTIGGLAGALSILLVWIANTFWMPTGKAIPADLPQQSLVFVLSLSGIKKESKRNQA